MIQPLRKHVIDTFSGFRCPTGLVFDLDGQTCNWAGKVNWFLSRKMGLAVKT
jgi:hypothetical protein